MPILLAVLEALAHAIPTPTLVSQACTTIIPSSMQSLLSTEPEIGFANEGLQGSGENGFSVFQDNFNASNKYHMLQFVDFEVPAGSYGCELYITDAANSISHSLILGKVWSNNVGATEFKVQSLVHDAFAADVSYNDVVKAPKSLISADHFGSFKIYNGSSSILINSETCPLSKSDGQNGHLQFVFDFRDHDRYTASYFSMTQRKAGDHGKLNGVYMTVNC
ncbi:unnamed protein product [Diplocarpon coronariae]|uniref:Ubiquitin 3 binding protein But2 C-terminal domain-containing protein n=1 Tax=Diplocarpon coronariae TaxID=2795749 RepID=A0A218ZE45_9HELO|nr:hypothetical protein JHW43_004367 [Diplocarpon mali]OWP06361.1 hypothetical protein B2J93_5314 [Marssonina coronariae]